MKTYHTLINADCRRMPQLEDSSVQLIVTSPPYWQLKDYGVEKQIGFNDTYEEYINNLNLVWEECYRVLAEGCRLCINVGDQFARTAYYGRYKVVPIHAEIIHFCEIFGFDYMGSIIWQKTTNTHTTGGEKVMGSYPYPRGGILKLDYEHILIFKKPGKSPFADKTKREASVLTPQEWNSFFSAHWCINGVRQNGHIAVFPEEIPRRLIKMFSFVGDVVLDPFMGSGTTALAARNLERHSIGYEINKDFRDYYIEKVASSSLKQDCEFFYYDTCVNDAYSNSLLKKTGKFTDYHKLNKLVDIKENTYGSIIEKQSPMKTMQLYQDATVLINHIRSQTKEQMIQTGICYLRAGESKGSVLVTPGFEKLQYVLLHTDGNNPILFPLKNKGAFQIWTKETLEQHGFHPQNALYYMVLLFDQTRPIPFYGSPNLKEKNSTYKVKIKSIKEFKIKNNE